MERLVIKGGRPLVGEVEVRGSKNAASKLIVASLLTKEPCVIENVPLSAEIDITRELCEYVGSDIHVEGRKMTIQTRAIKNFSVSELSRKNRIPILAIGPLLHRSGRAEVPVLGGCPIGHRPVNFHIEALNKLGARIERRERSYFAQASELQGAEIYFPYPSVGATENVLLSAVLAQGKTIVVNAAIEPEIMNLVDMLVKMGARISVDEMSRRVEIEGVSRLGGVAISVMPDRNEAVSFVTAALATDGDIFIKNIETRYLHSFMEKVAALGAYYEVQEGGIRFFGEKPYRAVSLDTAPHPAFMTDWQQPFLVLLTQARGKSIIHETVYEDRFGYTKDLQRMGADIMVSDECPEGSKCRFYGQTFNHVAHVFGPTKLRGGEITMTDIRAGMAHIVAALAAEGESVISGVEHVDRGYERIDERLRELGADIKRV
ncbi:MAG: UDP-N-acetylglucosamine 1-carboxyvinyltransferase [Candidatus Sungiibacteriota bacterium]|uniref:UDP-N-acetylglucosamine 1-carboxyvinyltransferase n=1 Tax=Candidatus Sungiibacteriota bacterium TaxID=2750080 RepID=A0A7T5RJ51_9BACT|nr:MAG: UDP-N-acetylglucosamine 1-carboxyvinyltransferase [Candidatus Sungbacteria bacterium]